MVDREPSPLPAVPRTAGRDLGLISFATIVANDGTIETIANPRFLRAAQRRLVRAQRQLSRKQKGSKNRARASRRLDAKAAHHGRQVVKVGHVRPGVTLAVASEAGTHRGAV